MGRYLGKARDFHCDGQNRWNICQLTPGIFNLVIISIWTKYLLNEENIRFQIQNVRGSIVIIDKNT